METFVIRRRGAWKDAAELKAGRGAARATPDYRSHPLIRSYGAEDDGTLGTVHLPGQRCRRDSPARRR
jgi:hypothetical protein